ncbi:MAG TPA: GAF domain-containing protein, partial [Fimbriimonas sp.]|nr:GAF domain-containing protein [Fimbriimonas sp.]
MLDGARECIRALHTRLTEWVGLDTKASENAGVGQKTVSPDIWELFDIPNIEQGGVGSYLTAILTRCSELFSAPVASVFVADRSGHIRCQAAIGTTISPTTTLSEGVGIAGTALLHGKAMLVNDPATNPIIAPQVTAKRTELGSAMVVPLITNGRKLGVLNLARNISAPAFNKTDLAKANTLAHHISLAVANWRLIEEIRS